MSGASDGTSEPSTPCTTSSTMERTCDDGGERFGWRAGEVGLGDGADLQQTWAYWGGEKGGVGLGDGAVLEQTWECWDR
eukprot:151095-Chlamydomonas_euryale.AAC.2